MSIYDNFEPTPSGDWVSFNQPGDTVTGVVVSVDSFTDTKYQPIRTYPILTLSLADGSQSKVRASTVGLRRAIVDQERPLPGDTVTITHTGKDGDVKLWRVEVVRGAAGQAMQPQMQPAQVQQPVQQVPVV